MTTENAFTRHVVGLSWIGAVLMSACTQPRMAPPADLNQGMDELPVEGRSAASGMLVNEDFKIAPYQVANVSRGAKHSSKFSVFGAFKASAESGYSFDFKSGDKSVHGECTSAAGEKGFSLGSTSISKQTAKLGCACGNDSAPSASVVMEAETGGQGYGGT